MKHCLSPIWRHSFSGNRAIWGIAKSFRIESWGPREWPYQIIQWKWDGVGSGDGSVGDVLLAHVWVPEFGSPTVMLILDIHGGLPAVSLSGSRQGCFRISWLVIRRAGCSDITQESLSQSIRWRVVKHLRWLHLCQPVVFMCMCATYIRAYKKPR